MTWYVFLFALLKDETGHFLLAFTLGSLVYCLISIILYVYTWVWEHLTRKKISTAVDWYMLIMSLLAGLSVALLSHGWLDGFSLWYVFPLSPHLNLIIR